MDLRLALHMISLSSLQLTALTCRSCNLHTSIMDKIVASTLRNDDNATKFASHRKFHLTRSIYIYTYLSLSISPTKTITSIKSMHTVLILSFILYQSFVSFSQHSIPTRTRTRGTYPRPFTRVGTWYFLPLIGTYPILLRVGQGRVGMKMMYLPTILYLSIRIGREREEKRRRRYIKDSSTSTSTYLAAKNPNVQTCEHYSHKK